MAKPKAEHYSIRRSGNRVELVLKETGSTWRAYDLDHSNVKEEKVAARALYGTFALHRDNGIIPKNSTCKFDDSLEEFEI